MSKLDWITCPSCGEQRYKHYDPYKYPDKIRKCGHCSSMGNKRGSRAIHYPRQGRGGYMVVWIDKKDFFFPMAAKAPNGEYGFIAVHRLVMAKHLGRTLHSWENVHHKNGDKTDNTIENLELVASNSEHIKNHSKGYGDGYRRGLIDGRLKQIQELKEKIRRLQNG